MSGASTGSAHRSSMFRWTLGRGVSSSRGEVLRRPESMAWRRGYLAALNMVVREARVISADTMIIFADGEEEEENT